MIVMQQNVWLPGAQDMGNAYSQKMSKGKGEEQEMKIVKEEMDAILAMYEVATWEGQETDTMINLVERIKKEKKK